MKSRIKYIVLFLAIVLIAQLLFLPYFKVTMPPEYWEKSAFAGIYPQLKLQVDEYHKQLRKESVIGKKRIQMKSWKSDVRESLLGNIRFGRTETSTSVVGYIKDGDANSIFPDSDAEHFVTMDNIADFRNWLAHKAENMESQQDGSANAGQ